ncbi:hypothetical protein B0H14DRAFT_2555802 [Mycena olivaceomarginata]|nr:hypothetical protein B0H14DRAFT_2555802 [Mycena olivaceomarginata]
MNSDPMNNIGTNDATDGFNILLRLQYWIVQPKSWPPTYAVTPIFENWRGNTAESKCLQPSATFKFTNPIFRGQIWFLSLRKSACSEFLLDEGENTTKQNGVCSSIRERLPGLPELLAVDADAKTLPRNTSFASLTSFRSTLSPWLGLSRTADIYDMTDNTSKLCFDVSTGLNTACNSLDKPSLPSCTNVEFDVLGRSERRAVSHCPGGRSASSQRTAQDVATPVSAQAMHGSALCFSFRWHMSAQAVAYAWRVGVVLHTHTYPFTRPIVFRQVVVVLSGAAKGEKTPESTFPSWYTLNVVADDELNGLKTTDNVQAVPVAVYPIGSRLWRDISVTVGQRRHSQIDLRIECVSIWVHCDSLRRTPPVLLGGFSTNLLQKPLYLGMFFGCAGEGATQEAQFEYRDLLLQTFKWTFVASVDFGGKPVRGRAFHSLSLRGIN